MLDFKDLTVDNVKTIDKNILTEVLYDSIQKMMEVQFIEVPKHEAASKIFIPAYDDIKKEIKYEYEKMNGKKFFKMSVPVIDETKRKRYTTPIFAANKPDKMPPRGYFILMEAEIKVMPLGLIEVYFKGYKRPRMAKDYKNLEPIKEYMRTEYIYFDYDENEFKQPITKEMEEVKIGLKKGKTLEELLRNKETAEYIEIYLEREQIKDISLARLVEYSERLQDSFLNFNDDKYDVKWEDDQLVRNKGIIARTDVTSNTLKQYLVRYGKFLTEKMPDWLKIHLIFSNITVNEFNRLSKYNTELVETLADIQSELFKLEQLLLKNNTNREQQITFQNIDWKTKKDLYIEEEELVKTIQSILDNTLEKPKEIRPKDFNKQLPLQGFIYDQETEELYPTFAEMENRRYLKEWYGSYLEDRKYIEEVLKSQK